MFLVGLTWNDCIPMAYFFTKKLKGSDLKLIVHVMKEIEEIGFKIACVVSDNHWVNEKAFKELCNGTLKEAMSSMQRKQAVVHFI